MKTETPQLKFAEALGVLVETLKDIPEAEQPGNAAYYLMRVAEVAVAAGVDEPMFADIWLQDSLISRAEEDGLPTPARDQARAMMAALDQGYDSAHGVNWDVISFLLEVWDFS